MSAPRAFASLGLLRQVAPRLSKRFFTCNSVQHSSKPLITRLPLGHPGPWAHSPLLRRLSTRVAGPESSPLGYLGQDLARNPEITTKFFPNVSSKPVAYWLLASAASVFGLVVFGGLTRLTESGLSITEWRPVAGSLPPMNQDDWDSEFNKYRNSPEFQLLNPRMTLDEFKSIYYMEWGHRLWGRLVGITFVGPALYFMFRRRLSSSMAMRVAGITGLIGFQGFLGWWMVKSGLKDDLFAPGSHPRVSQYRLTAHLGTAFICYTAMLWNGLTILKQHKIMQNPEASLQEFGKLSSPALSVFRRSVAGLALLVFCTAMSGGLVAGLDAGLIYNEFPFMGEGLTPPKAELLKDFYSHREDKSDLWWRNMLENPSLVQLDHRILATTSFTSIVALFVYGRYKLSAQGLLPRTCMKGLHGVLGFACLQVALGITTLLYLVPLPLASAHQAGSLALLTWIMILGRRTWIPNNMVQLAQKHAKYLNKRA